MRLTDNKVDITHRKIYDSVYNVESKLKEYIIDLSIEQRVHISLSTTSNHLIFRMGNEINR